MLIRPVNAPRITRVVRTEQDAKDLIRHFNRLGMAGVDLAQALADAKTEGHRLYPPLREVLPAFLDEQVNASSKDFPILQRLIRQTKDLTGKEAQLQNPAFAIKGPLSRAAPFTEPRAQRSITRGCTASPYARR